MIPKPLIISINAWLKSTYKSDTSINTYLPLSGGSINEAFHVKTNSGDFFLKYNLGEKYPGMFESEAKGLCILGKANVINVPQVLHVDTALPYSYIILQHVKNGKKAPNYWNTFALQLSNLHRVKSESFGLDHDNYIGSLNQKNDQNNDYFKFIIEQRLQPQVKTAFDVHLLKSVDLEHFTRLFKRLPEIIPLEKPTLLHGDLWSGNLITNALGLPCLIDPAVYYGQRETDIAMTLLFGGFSEYFYDSYNQYYPLQFEWRNRIAIHQLYYLLVHVNLFDQGYVRQVQQIIKKF